MSDISDIKKKLEQEEEYESSFRISEGSNLISQVYDHLKDEWMSECKELCQLLRNVNIRASLYAADCIARGHDYLPLLPSQCEQTFINGIHDINGHNSHDEKANGKAIKIVQVIKDDEEPLGATVTIDESNGRVAIERVIHGYAAYRSGLVSVGDEVCEVNGQSLTGKTKQEILDLLESECHASCITFKLIPIERNYYSSSHNSITSKLVVRALFDYNPEEDASHPCVEIGLAFTKGNILHIVNQDDTNWWQARKEVKQSIENKLLTLYSRAGLVPGKILQERRVVAMRDLKSQYDAQRFIEIVPGLKTPFKKRYFSPRKVKKIIYDVSSDKFDLYSKDLATYEQVTKYCPPEFTLRPVVIIGVEGVGRKEIIRQLIAHKPGHYEQPIAHTDRKIWDGEVNGFDYYFVSREWMEKEINRGEFVEYGKFESHLYGIHKTTITNIINSGCVCLMNPHPQTLKNLYNAKFKPYIIYLKPSSDVQRLLQIRNSGHKEILSEETARQMIIESHQLNSLYSHYFDITIENDSLKETVLLLIQVLNSVESEPQWVPTSWTIANGAARTMSFT